MRPFPILLIPLVVYNVVAPFGLQMTTPVAWVVSFEDMLTTIALVLLGIEIWRSTNPTPETAKRQVANLIVLLVCLAEWLLPWCNSGVFLVLTVTTFVNLVVSCYVAFVVKGQGRNVWVANR